MKKILLILFFIPLLVVSQTSGEVIGDAWSNYLPGSKDLIADWTDPVKCGNFNIKTGKCSGQNF